MSGCDFMQTFCDYLYFHDKLYFNLQAGVWKLDLMNKSPTNQNVTIIVQSRARKIGQNQVDPIQATAKWGKESINIMGNTVESNNQTLYVTVSKGKKSVATFF